MAELHMCSLYLGRNSRPPFSAVGGKRSTQKRIDFETGLSASQHCVAFCCLPVRHHEPNNKVLAESRDGAETESRGTANESESFRRLEGQLPGGNWHDEYRK